MPLMLLHFPDGRNAGRRTIDTAARVGRQLLPRLAIALTAACHAQGAQPPARAIPTHTSPATILLVARGASDLGGEPFMLPPDWIVEQPRLNAVFGTQPVAMARDEWIAPDGLALHCYWAEARTDAEAQVRSALSALGRSVPEGQVDVVVGNVEVFARERHTHVCIRDRTRSAVEALHAPGMLAVAEQLATDILHDPPWRTGYQRLTDEDAWRAAWVIDGQLAEQAGAWLIAHGFVSHGEGAYARVDAGERIDAVVHRSHHDGPEEIVVELTRFGTHREEPATVDVHTDGGDDCEVPRNGETFEVFRGGAWVLRRRRGSPCRFQHSSGLNKARGR